MGLKILMVQVPYMDGVAFKKLLLASEWIATCFASQSYEDMASGATSRVCAWEEAD